MSEPTLRSLTLNYYRKQGGQAQPVDTLRRRWEIRLDGQRLDLAFDLAGSERGSPAAPERPVVVIPGSPKWGEILADCARRGAVSYRYLVGGPVADPAALLAPVVPENHKVAGVRLAAVARRTAVAFTHRVVYNAPALSAPPDELHHDVVDVETGCRHALLSESWTSLTTLSVESPGPVRGIEALHARVLDLVDSRTTERGKKLEEALQAKLVEVEHRLRQHYADLRAEVQAREVADLTGRLDRVVSQIQAATPLDLNRLRHDGAALAKKLDQAKKGVSTSMASLERIEAHALEGERDRHEVTLTTELVALCVVTYDVVTYHLDLLPMSPSPDGLAPPSLCVRYVPVTGELEAPPCEACGQPATDPVITVTGRYGCRPCAAPCENCGQAALTAEASLVRCHACKTGICEACRDACAMCRQSGCQAHVFSCKGCGTKVCVTCRAVCSVCAEPLCPSCSLELHRRIYCTEHILSCERCHFEIPFDLVQRCHLTGATYCVACAMACVECGKVTRRELLVSAGRGLVCPEHLVACATCAMPLLPREASVCASCGRHHCPNEARGCSECGLVTCGSCKAEGESRCGVCSQLEEVPADDSRLGAARSAVGEASAQRWLLAQAAGGHVVVEWHGRLGAWGRTALSPEGEIVAMCRYGPVAALIQEVAGRIGRA